MAHLRTKRKPSVKNIGKLVFSLVLVFIFMVILINLSNFAKGEIQHRNNLVPNIIGSKALASDAVWTLENDKKIYTNNGDLIFTDVVDNEIEREMGLSGKEKLKAYKAEGRIITEGMLFVFKEEQTTNFWMKDMTFNLDIIWLDGNYKIVHIEKNVSANSYNAQDPSKSKTFTNGNNLAKYVLEINGGLSDQMNLKTGDTLKVE